MPEASGWQMLGNALGGNSEKAYQEGMALGANTQNALAQARARVDENKAKQELADTLSAVLPPDLAAAASTTLRAGGNLGDVFGARAKQQEYDFRALAGDPNTPIDVAQRSLLGVASGPVEQYYKVGGGYADKFNSGSQITPLGDSLGGSAGGDSAFIQAGRAFGVLDDAGRVADVNHDGQIDNADRAVAYEIMRNTNKVYEEGGVPQQFSANPFRGGSNPAPQPGAAPAPAPSPVQTAPLSTAEQVAANAGAIERAKTIERERGQAYSQLPQAQALLRNQTQNTDSVIANIDKALGIADWSSTGPAGAVLRNFAFTDAGALQRVVDTIKANTGFQQLQQMRAENATGAGLGQIAVQELMYLQAALGNLDTAQTPEQLAAALGEVRRRYGQFRSAMEQDFKNKVSFATGGAPIPQVGAPSAPAASAGGAMPLQDYLKMKRGGG